MSLILYIPSSYSHAFLYHASSQVIDVISNELKSTLMLTEFLLSISRFYWLSIIILVRVSIAVTSHHDHDNF